MTPLGIMFRVFLNVD